MVCLGTLREGGEQEAEEGKNSRHQPPHGQRGEHGGGSGGGGGGGGGDQAARRNGRGGERQWDAQW